MKTMLVRIFLYSGIVFILSSCHSEYVCLDYDVHFGSVSNNDTTNVVFVTSKTAYKSASGISAFPDGGISDYLIQNMGLYIFNLENQKLTQLVEFNDLAEWLGASLSNWNVKIAFYDSVVYYNINPVTEWNWYLNKARSGRDTLFILSFKEKYNKAYSFNIYGEKGVEIDTASFLDIYQNCIETNKYNLTDLNKKLSEVPLADWGLVIKDIFPKPDKDYIEETIYLQNGSAKTRQAVIEQIIAKMDKREIKYLLEKMDEYKNSLEGLKKTEYEVYSKDTYESIRALQ